MDSEIRGKLSLDASGVKRGVAEAKQHTDALPASAEATSSRLGAIFSGLRNQVGKGLGGVAAGVSGTIGSTFARLGPLLLAGIGAVGLAGGAAGIAKKVGGEISKGGELFELSLQTGEGVGRLMKLQKAFRETGIGADGVAPAMARLQKALGGISEDGQETGDVFKRLGLNAQALKGMSGSQQIAAVGSAIGRLPTQVERTSAAMAIFGKSGAEMLKLFRDKETLDSLNGPLSVSQRLMQANAALFDELGDKWEAFKGRASGGFGLFIGLAAGVAPALKMVMSYLPNLDFAPIGARIGNAISLGFAAFRNGRLGELVSVSLQLAFANSVNWFSDNFLQMFVRLAFLIVRVLDAIFSTRTARLLEGTLKDGFFSALAALSRGLSGVAGDFVATMARGLALLADSNPIFAATGVGDKMRGFADFIQSTPGRIALGVGGTYLEDRAAQARMQATGAALELQDLLSKFVGNGFRIDTANLRTELGALLKFLQPQVDKERQSNGDQTGKKKDEDTKVSLGVSALQRIGGGGGVGGGSLLETSREMAQTLRVIARNTTPTTANPSPVVIPQLVFSNQAF